MKIMVFDWIIDDSFIGCDKIVRGILISSIQVNILVTVVTLHCKTACLILIRKCPVLHYIDVTGSLHTDQTKLFHNVLRHHAYIG